jgi:ornithine decarboxylase
MMSVCPQTAPPLAMSVDLAASSSFENSATPVISRLTETIRVPTDVINKFNVENNGENKTVEEILAAKLEDETIEKEEAFYVIDLGTVLKKYRQWVNALPRVKPYYAVKCNPNTAIIKTLASVGVNFDCASKTEIQLILGSGVSASRIIYANPTKMKSHINYAKSSGVDMMTFDNVFELEKIASCYPESRLLLRIITDDSQSICKFSTKFGAPMDQITSILAKAQELNLNIVGVSFHVGSGCMSVNSFVSAIQSAKRVFQQATHFGFNMNTLDLGGGWPGTDDDGIRFDDIAAGIRPYLDSLFGPEIDIIAEPGRYFVAESHTLAVNVFAKREMFDEENNKKYLYYVNDGVYQSFNCIFFDHVHPKPLVFAPGNRTEEYKCTIFGPTCDSMDCIAKDILLPELEIGEWLYFKCMGAYTTAAASPFNGFKSHPTTFYIQSEL